MQHYEQAARELLNRRKAGFKGPRLDNALRPQNIDDALAIHSAMAKIQEVRAWKCLLPPQADQIIAAPIFNLQSNTRQVRLFECDNAAMVEPEIAFVLGKDLVPRHEPYAQVEILDAIASAHMALELMQFRFAPDADQSFYESLADCMVNQGVYVGPEIDKTRAINASEISISIEQEQHKQVLDGKHPNSRAIDGLLWLINYLCARGVGFVAGQAIITGSFKGIVELEFEQLTRICYENLGEVSLSFTRA